MMGDVRGERAAEPKRPSCVVWSLLSPWSGSCPTSAADYELPDLPTLRASSPFVPAPPTFTRWSGFYAGGQVGYGDAHVEFSRSTQQLLQSVLRELALESEQHVSLWKVLGPGGKSGASLGGFVGYNSQWDDIILGVDLTYSKTSFKAVSPVIADQSPHDSGRQRLRRDGLWFREHENPRLGLGALSRRLGRRQLDALCDSRTRVRPPDITRSATATGEENPPDPPQTCATDVTPPICVPFTFTKGEEKRNAWLFGWTVGGGLDYLVLPNVFLRAEYNM